MVRRFILQIFPLGFRFVLVFLEIRLYSHMSGDLAERGCWFPILQYYIETLIESFHFPSSFGFTFVRVFINISLLPTFSESFRKDVRKTWNGSYTNNSFSSMLLFVANGQWWTISVYHISFYSAQLEDVSKHTMESSCYC